jgi:hypothetical protein
MGLTFTKLFARLFSKKEMRILMVSRVTRCRPVLRERLTVVEGWPRPVRRLLVRGIASMPAGHSMACQYAAVLRFSSRSPPKACGCSSCQQQACQF